MHTNYSSLGGRSRSTTDIFKAHSLDDRSSQPSVGSSSLQYSINRRRRAVPAPPPRRCENFTGVFPYTKIEEPPPPRRLDIETSITGEGIETPRTSFLRKLAASLERRQREISAASEIADDEFVIIERDGGVARRKSEEEERRRRVITRDVEKQRRVGYARLPLIRHLEDLQERSEQEDDDEVDDPQKRWSTSDLVAPPILPIVNNNNDVSIEPDPKPRSSFQQTIKNMFFSFMNWRTSATTKTKSLPRNLPRGSREYYSARESLGDEMGAFRKHTMPRLIKHATSKGRLDNSLGETSRRKEFSNFIGKSNEADYAVPLNKPNIATIHPVYGTLKNGKRMSRLSECGPTAESVYGSMKVQLPEVPIRQSSLPLDHHLLFLPSKFRNRQKSVTSLTEPRSLSRASWNRYDVPRVGMHQFSPPNYENFKHVAPRPRPGIRQFSPSPGCENFKHIVPRPRPGIHNQEPKISSPEYENFKQIAGYDKRIRNYSMCTKF